MNLVFSRENILFTLPKKHVVKPINMHATHFTFLIVFLYSLLKLLLHTFPGKSAACNEERWYSDQET